MKIRTTIFIFLITLCLDSYPQSSVKFSHFTSEFGAPQSPVNTIYQDKTGFIWFGTTDGLFRYDGYEFIIYQNDRKDSMSLSDNYIRSIIQDNKGSFWIGTKAGLNKLLIIKDEKSGETKEGFYHYFHNPEDTLSLSSNDIRTIFQDKEGNIWVGTSNGLNLMLNEHDKKSSENIKKFRRYLNDINKTASLSSNNISSIAEDNNGNIYIGTMGGGINIINKNKEVYKVYKNNQSGPSGLKSNYIVTLYIDLSGRLWIGTYGGGLAIYDKNRNGFTYYINDPLNTNSLSDNKVYSITEDARGSFWIGTFGKGICRFDPETGFFKNFKNDPLNLNSLTNDFVREIHIDNSQIMWIGTNNGIDILDLKPAKFFHLNNEKSTVPVISDNYILSIIEDKNGILWIGTNKGLDKIDRKNGDIKSYKVDHNNPKSEDGFVYSLCEDKGGNIWLGTFGGGLYKFIQGSERFFQYRHNPDDAESLIDNRVTKLFLFDTGDLLVGTVTGICRFDPVTGKSRQYIISDDDSVKLAKKWIQSIIMDSDSDIWIGTTSGLFKIENLTGNCFEFLPDSKNINSLSDERINSIDEDRTGIIWIGTDNGLNCLDKKNGEFFSFFLKDGLPNNIITNVVCDSAGLLWITTSRGLSVFNPLTNHFRNYDPDDGLQGFEFNTGASFINKNNEIFFGGHNGLNWFSPVQLNDNPYIPTVAFTSFSKFDRIVRTAVELSTLEEIALSHNDSYFSFEFSALDFTNPRKNNFAYKLEGFDDNWVYNGNRRFANYTSINPGEYVFRVKASNSDGVWNEEGISIRLIIHPPFYSTWWAYIIYVLVFVSALAGFRRYELNKRKRREEENLNRERESAKLKEMQLRVEASEYKAKVLETKKEIEKQQIRNRIASDLHDEIGSNLSSISLLSSLAKKEIKQGGEAIRYLEEINIAAKISSESIREIIWFINPMSDQLINLISKMKETANLMLGGINYKINSKEFEAEEKINPDIRRNIYLIFKEILNNILRHSKASFVKIDLERNNNDLIITVEDNGIGFDKHEIKSGNGLKNLKYRAEEIKGELKINSQKGNGTAVSLKVQV